MTYVISDPKGCLRAYRNLLRQIRFKDTDTMYVLGNLVGDGPDPVGLLKEMSMQSNVMPVLGDDDYRAYRILNRMRTLLMEKQTPDNRFLKEMSAWISDGGQKTLDQFRELSDEMQEGILDYLSDMLLYAEISVKGADYLLVHKGITDYTPDLDLDVCGPDDFLGDPFDPKVEYDPNRVILMGHVPVSSIPDAEPGKIFYGPNMIALNCEVTEDGCLGCLCLDNGQEYYETEPED